MNADTLPPTVADSLADNRAEPFDLSEAPVGFGTRNPPGCAAEPVAWSESTLGRPATEAERSAVAPDEPTAPATIEGAGDRTPCFDGPVGTVPVDARDWSSDPLVSPIVDASAQAAEHVVDARVSPRSATRGGDATVSRHGGRPTVEFGFGTLRTHGTDECTTTEAVVRNATSYGTLPVLSERRTSADK